MEQPEQSRVQKLHGMAEYEKVQLEKIQLEKDTAGDQARARMWRDLTFELKRTLFC